ncbi:protein trichome birefringence-like 24 [Impatiens glandulifera]|uniref:protein trichome birefringence-like 24 n=1 Tax=Impatiens glandulifera TaxID=253017 RepID=UPI001FB06C6B|nr:protein trichome birefringence-like 24 [Impatiens glandulifera]
MKANGHSGCWFLHKHTDILAKIVISILLIGVGFRVFSPRLNPSPSIAEKETPFLQEEEEESIAVTFDPPANPDQISIIEETKKCDLFNGDWIPNIAGPAYTNESCSLIENHQNCMMNGRPDTGYLYWKWKPRDCNLLAFNGKRFLKMMRNKSWALIGDSITRNHVQSLLCILSKVEQAIEVYHDSEYKSKRWYFPSHNFTVSVIWSPFLVKAAIFENNDGISTSEIKLQLDKLDQTWTKQFQQWDYMIFSSGKWFIKTAIYYENNTVSGCHYCANKKIKSMGYNSAYRQVLKSVFNFILESNYKGMIFYRTTTPDHFEDGQWFSGGSCRRTEPAKEGEYKLNELIQILRDVELEEFAEAEARALEKGINLKLLDLIELTLTRPDGHPGPYRHFQPFAKDENAKVGSDCLHWCLPGPIDSWNDVIMEMVLNR